MTRPFSNAERYPYHFAFPVFRNPTRKMNRSSPSVGSVPRSGTCVTRPPNAGRSVNFTFGPANFRQSCVACRWICESRTAHSRPLASFTASGTEFHSLGTVYAPTICAKSENAANPTNAARPAAVAPITGIAYPRRKHPTGSVSVRYRGP